MPTPIELREWRPTSFRDVCLCFLRAENKQFSSRRSLLHELEIRPEDSFDLSDPDLSFRRQWWLYKVRWPLLVEIPLDSLWHRVTMHLPEDGALLRAINHPSWTAPGEDSNEIEMVARRNPVKLNARPMTWEPPVLWGHSKAGPFTILEGNNRLTGYFTAGEREPASITAIIGISELPCCWHLPDHGRVSPNRIAAAIS